MRRHYNSLSCLLLSGLSWCIAVADGPVSQNKWFNISRADLCVTEGTVEESPRDGLFVTAAKMRAYVNVATPPVVVADFTYLGSTLKQTRLGSGEMRRQFGLKMRAQDACNLVYVMWRIEPQSRLVVSVKSNPGQHRSSECGNRGYRNIQPTHGKPLPALHSGEAHSLRAELSGEQLRVLADTVLVWEGALGPETMAFDGPVGIRSDNARLQIQLHTAQPQKTPPAKPPACRADVSESE